MHSKEREIGAVRERVEDMVREYGEGVVGVVPEKQSRKDKEREIWNLMGSGREEVEGGDVAGDGGEG